MMRKFMLVFAVLVVALAFLFGGDRRVTRKQ